MLTVHWAQPPQEPAAAPSARTAALERETSGAGAVLAPSAFSGSGRFSSSRGDCTRAASPISREVACASS